MVLEVCAYNIASCIIAGKAGAGRIELCVNPLEGGITPSFGLIEYVAEYVPIPAFPMIRPRGGSYVYDTHELAIMKKDILRCRDMGCKGIATGIQLPDGRLDADNMKRLVEWAYPMQVTCHKAFDVTPDAFAALDVLIAAGVSRVLTSGLRKTALEGADLLRQLVATADGRIVIMPGGSVRSSNIAQLAAATGAVEFHSSGILSMAMGQVANEDEVRKMVNELK
ncbi:copper homeostasis protein CutC [Nemorincola caseinilytica]|uniref:PF03932 family protein CutC n=1 Tax=Nemorincola caseinilytica TaxID=2054315 RepID=A0ABP8NRV0_9BACT